MDEYIHGDINPDISEDDETPVSINSERMLKASKITFAETIAGFAKSAGIKLEDVDIDADVDTVTHSLLDKFSEDELMDIHSIINETFLSMDMGGQWTMQVLFL